MLGEVERRAKELSIEDIRLFQRSISLALFGFLGNGCNNAAKKRLSKEEITYYDNNFVVINQVIKSHRKRLKMAK